MRTILTPDRAPWACRSILGLDRCARLLVSCGDEDPPTSRGRRSAHGGRELLPAGRGGRERWAATGVDGDEPHPARRRAARPRARRPTRSRRSRRPTSSCTWAAGSSPPSRKRVVRARRRRRSTLLDRASSVERDGDPHVWLDPIRYADVVGRRSPMRSPRSSADDAGGVHRRAAPAFGRSSTSLDADVRRRPRDCERAYDRDATQRSATSPSRYGLRRTPSPASRPKPSPTPAGSRSSRDLVEAEGVTTIFTEELVSPTSPRPWPREAGVDTAVLNPLEGSPTSRSRPAPTTFRSCATTSRTLRERLSACD